MITSHRHNSIAGFTLVELLVALGVLMIVLGLLIFPLLTGYAFMEKGNARSDALQTSQLALDTVSRELAEAIYVFDPPASRDLLSFYLGSGSQPVPQQVGASPLAIRYWRALRDPALAYDPFWPDNAKAQWNNCYLARAEVTDPQLTSDPWNGTRGGTRPVMRARYRYPDSYSYLGVSWPTAQPGWPWLEAFRLYPAAGDIDTRYQWYLDHAVGLTPNHDDYDLVALEFTPSQVDNETLAPVRPGGRWPPDYAVYRSRYPLWCNFSLWDEQVGAFREQGKIRIYRPDPVAGMTLRYYTALDSDGDVCIYEQPSHTLVYNTDHYPSRDGADYAFGIDYDHGRLLFGFDATDSHTGATGVATFTLDTVSGVLGGRVVTGSDHVKVDGVYYTRVSADPGAGEYTITPDDPSQPTEWTIGFDPDVPPAADAPIVITYRYHNASPADLLVANYRTKGIIQVDLSVARRDRSMTSTPPPAQDPLFYVPHAHLSATVKLHNVVK